MDIDRLMSLPSARQEPEFRRAVILAKEIHRVAEETAHRIVAEALAAYRCPCPCCREEGDATS
jgi:hypothetical protein